MSHVGVIVSMCLPSACVPEPLRSLEGVSAVPDDADAFLYAPSRNGWLNRCIAEIVHARGLSAFPSREMPPLNLSGASLAQPIAELRVLLGLFAVDPIEIPAFARWQANPDTLARAALPGPASLAEAQAAFREANADGEGEDVPALMALLWCQLRLMEYAQEHDLCFVSSELDG